MPALIISANLPDIDSFFARSLGYEAIEAHRGFSHGLGGLVTLPFLAVAIFYSGKNCDRQRRTDRVRALLLVCFLGVLSHPILDFMNTYGAAPRPSVATLVLRRHALHHRPVDMDRADPRARNVVARRAARPQLDAPATWALGAVLGYIALNAAISLRAEALTRPLVERVAEPRMIVAGEVPLQFWRRRMIWRGDTIGGSGTYDPLQGLNHVWLNPKITPLRLDDPRLAAAARRDKRVRAFLLVADADGLRAGRPRLSDGPAVL